MSRGKSYKNQKGKTDSKTKAKQTGNSNKQDAISKHNDRRDLMDHRSDYSNDFRWYAKDPVIADQISQFSFNVIEGVTPVDGVIMPGVMRIVMNPSLGTTPDRMDSSLTPIVSADNTKLKGINIAAQKWWYSLTSRSGRGATYSKSDIGMLIGALGEVISTTEFIRRALGTALTYSQRNRMFPAGIWQAMGIDGDDLMANMADYRMKVNILIAKINQLPIPGNIDYLNKCQDIYQKIFADSASDMAQMYVFVPASTWYLDESSYVGGSVLRTLPMVWEAAEGSRDIGQSSGGNVNINTSFIEPYADTNGKYIRPLSYYINVLDYQINKLLFSSTFSVIYSDLLNLASSGHLTLWAFDLIKEDYVVQPEYDALALQQIHNMDLMGNIRGVERQTFENWIQSNPTADYGIKYKYGTPSNDVYSDVDTDTLVYNPTFLCSNLWNNSTSDFRACYMGDLLIDSMVPNPGVDLRIDMTRYKCYINDRNGDFRFHNPDTLGALALDEYRIVTDMLLPDHYVLGAEVFSDNSGIPSMSVVNRPFISRLTVDTNNVEKLSKFDWKPLVHLNVKTSSPEGIRPYPVFGDLNYYCTLDHDWMVRVLDMTYLNLFDVG